MRRSCDGGGAAVEGFGKQRECWTDAVARGVQGTVCPKNETITIAMNGNKDIAVSRAA